MVNVMSQVLTEMWQSSIPSSLLVKFSYEFKYKLFGVVCRSHFYPTAQEGVCVCGGGGGGGGGGAKSE